MGRSLKKGPYVVERLLERVYRADQSGNREPIKTWARDCTIVPDFVGHTFLIHNGRTFMRLFVIEDMVGHKLGEFAPTRIFKGHTTKVAERAAAAAAAGAAGAPGAAGAAAPAAGATPAGAGGGKPGAAS